MHHNCVRLCMLQPHERWWRFSLRRSPFPQIFSSEAGGYSHHLCPNTKARTSSGPLTRGSDCIHTTNLAEIHPGRRTNTRSCSRYSHGKGDTWGPHVGVSAAPQKSRIVMR